MYIFNWDNVPGKDDGKLIEFLEQKYGVNWARTGKIEKIGSDDIKITTEKNFLLLTLNNQKTNVILKVNDIKTDVFDVKIEDGNTNIYKDVEKVTRQGVKLESNYPYAILGGLVLAGLIIVAFLGYSGVESAGIFSPREAFFVIGSSILILTAASIYLLLTLRNTISVLKFHEEELQSARDMVQEQRIANLESTRTGVSLGPRVSALEPQLASLEERVTKMEKQKREPISMSTIS